MSSQLRGRCHFMRSWLANHGGKAPVGNGRVAFAKVAGAVRLTPSLPRLFHQPSALLSSRLAVRCLVSSADNDSAMKLGETKPKNDEIKLFAALQPTQPKPPLQLMGRVLGERWFGTYSPQKSPQNRRGFLEIEKFQTIEQAANAAFNPTQTAVAVDGEDGRRALVGTYSPQKPPQNSKELFMNNFETIEQAADAAFDKLNELNPRSLSSFWSRVSQLTAPKYQRNIRSKQELEDSHRHRLKHELESIFVKTMGEITKFGPRDLAQTSLGFAKVVKIVDYQGSQRRLHGTQQILHDILVGQQSQQRQKIIFQTIAEASLPVISQFDGRCLSNLAYANAIVGSAPVFGDGGTLFDSIAEASIPILQNAIVGSAPVFGDGGTLFDSIAEASIPILQKFEPQEISNMVWSFEKVGSSNPRLFEKVAEHIVSLNHLGKFKPQELSNILLAFAKAVESNPCLFEKVSDQIITLDLNSFNPQDLSNVVWAFAKSEESNPMLFKKVADQIITRDLNSFKPQNLSNVVWAFARARESNPILFKRVAEHLISLDLNSFEPQHVSNTIWAFSKAGESNQSLFNKVADHILALDTLDAFNPKDCTQLLWGFAVANIPHGPLYDRVAAHANQFDFAAMDKRSKKMLLFAYETAEKSKRQKRGKSGKKAS
eukprot:CAMPEP_0172574214 /NCGR_PEP_ID=MMETSP1067-20121228/136589_1 /TAXON_ID=265564 ORGANISM="Thalassiosira punctigera, Strain Tpunct2005C2" /NCGR_SAMPLE_ID=MMETSP1067 /ASSEMBLY_ACC=CAM_ASM_000444 /LENGTH=656 /DNA_ID=CAMNT_0013366837 /DNA_START=34 /DNA_END=2006 /DNA_ORIENTATION=-